MTLKKDCSNRDLSRDASTFSPSLRKTDYVMQKVFILCVILSVSYDGYAQAFKAISGKIVDQESGDALPFSTVYILGEAIGTIANEKGDFQLKIPHRHWKDSLTVSHLGFQNFYGIVNELPLE